MRLDRRSLLGYGHGTFWKIASLSSKLGFVFLVLPRLPDGVFAEYAFLSSIALLGSLVFSFGAMDTLPVLVRGRLRSRNSLAPLVQISFLVTAATFCVFLATNNVWALVAAVAGCSIFYFVLSGLLRSTNPYLFEILSNAPSLLFVLLAALLASSSANVQQLLIYFFAANLAVSAVMIVLSGMLAWKPRRDLRYSLLVFRQLTSSGNAKSLSAILMIADFRALITFPNLVLHARPNDLLAVALTIGEALWQLAMVVINRNYVRYCAGLGSLQESIGAATKLLAAIALVGVILLTVPIPVSFARFDWIMIGWASLFFAAMTALVELRTFYWSRGLFDLQIIGVQIAIVIVQILLVVALPEPYWLPASASALLAATLLGLLVLRQTNDRSKPRL